MIVVVGAGAAGLVASIFARSGGAPVRILERTPDGGRKILISGGGRCNILPSALRPERFVTDSPAPVMRGLLRSWPLQQQRRFFEDEVGLPLALEADTGKLFPRSNRARDVRDGLVTLATGRGVQWQGDTVVTDLLPPADGRPRWRLTTSRGELEADSVILATGGRSVPRTGSDGLGLGLAAALGHTMHPTYPALTPITGTAPGGASLAGVSLPVRLRARADSRTTESDGGFLFTHRGFSGPSVLDVSHVIARFEARLDEARPELRARWTPIQAADWDTLLSDTPGRIACALARHLPERLAEALMRDANVPLDRRGAELRRTERIALVDRLVSAVLPWTGTEGYAKAEVTGGGVALTEVDPRTLESRRHAGLHFCGEILDAFGPIGGYNFAWAWATGRLAGLGAARSPRRSARRPGEHPPSGRILPEDS